VTARHKAGAPPSGEAPAAIGWKSYQALRFGICSGSRDHPGGGACAAGRLIGTQLRRSLPARQGSTAGRLRPLGPPFREREESLSPWIVIVLECMLRSNYLSLY
jgi:hypothetical protein